MEEQLLLMKILLTILLATETCSLVFKRRILAEEFVMKRISLLGKQFDVNCKGKKYIQKTLSPTSNIEIQTTCTKTSIGNYMEVDYDFKNFKKKLRFELDDNFKIILTSQTDYGNNFHLNQSFNWQGFPFYYGASFKFDTKKNQVESLTCNGLYKENSPNMSCKELLFNSDKSVKECYNDCEDYRFTNKKQFCKPVDCAEIIPFITLGQYSVIFNEVEVKEKPSSEAKTLFLLDEDDKVEVLEDTQIFAEINYDIAPWVKIRTRKGKEGYVFGAGIAEIR